MKAAEGTVKDLVTHFNKQPIKQEVKAMVVKNAELILVPEKTDEHDENQ